MIDPTHLLTLAVAGAADFAGIEGTQARPLRMHIEQSGDFEIVRVKGESTVACSASYELEVKSGPGGGNRSRQSGTATLHPGKPVTVATVRFLAAGNSGWEASLSVRPCNGPPYQERKGIAAPSES